MCQCFILTCQSVSLVSLDGDHTLGVGYLHSGIGSVDDRHKLQEEMPPKDEVVTYIEAGNFERQHLFVFVVSYPTGYIEIDAPNGSGRLSRDYFMERVMHNVRSDKLRPISMKVFLMMRLSEVPLSIRVLVTLCRPIGSLTTKGKFLSHSSVSG
jgi:hypothetical protein